MDGEDDGGGMRVAIDNVIDTAARKQRRRGWRECAEWGMKQKVKRAGGDSPGRRTEPKKPECLLASFYGKKTVSAQERVVHPPI